MTNNVGKKFHDTHPWKWIQLMKRVSPNYQRTVNTCWGPACKLIKQHKHLNFRIGVLKQFGTISISQNHSTLLGVQAADAWDTEFAMRRAMKFQLRRRDLLPATRDSLNMTAWQPQHDSMTAWAWLAASHQGQPRQHNRLDGTNFKIREPQEIFFWTC